MKRAPAIICLALIGGCANAPAKVSSSGKSPVADAPAEVLAAARAARADFESTAVEYETRDGRLYYDVSGTSDGSEIEFDITEVDGAWTVVETQRDISADLAPPPVLAALYEERPGFDIARIIESDQGDGVVIYEFFTQDGAKAEIKWSGGAAEYLTAEWAH